ncbi:MAG: hypothetical protein KUG72_07855 [Pseudomonadales bacterium]|nr:hypothetical protein [Pseudomonadales bacterium]
MNRLGKISRKLARYAALLFLVQAMPGYTDSIQVPSTIAVKSSKSLLVNSDMAGDRIFTVGGRGHILYSDDGGSTWTQANSPTQMLLTGIDFIDNMKGWAVGHDSVILGTEDGGKNWNILFEAPDIEKPLLDVVFFDAQNGLVVGAYGLIMRTSDGGKTWQEFMIGTLDWHFNSINRVGEHVLIAGEAGTLARSSDQGKTWQQLESPYVGSFFGLIEQPLEEGHQIIAYGLRGHAFISNDSGDSWTELDTGVTTNILGGTFTPSGDTILLGAGGTVLRQASGDTGFNKVPYRGFENLTSVIAVNDTELVIFGVRGSSKLKMQ